MTGRIFQPKPAPTCAKCDLPMAFVELANGKWRPCNPDGSDHWDVCRDVRYAKAKSGSLREEVETYENPDRTETIWYWDGGKKPFVVRHSIMLHGQREPIPGAGLRPLEQLRALARRHRYTLISYDERTGEQIIYDGAAQ